jgi:uncharacterized lipoprotein YmbA
MSPRPDSTRPLPRRRFPRGVAFAVSLGGAAVLVACGTSPPTRFFTLDAAPPATAPASAYAGAPLRVVAVNIPPALDRVELVSEIGAGEMKVHDFERWEAPLGLTARQVLTQDLATRLPAGKVLGPGVAGAGVATLSVEVLSFQAAGGQATMQASWTLHTPAGRPNAPPVLVRSDLVQLSAPAPGAGGDATAEGFSALLGQLADRIAAGLGG